MSAPAFRCGHPRSAENTVTEQGTTRCIICKRARARKQRPETEAERRLEYRVRYLPIALGNAREKLRDLIDEARALGLTDLIDEPRRLTGNQILNNPELVDRAWEREAEIARIQARL